MKQKSEIKRTGPELLKRLLRQREMSVFLIILLVVAIVAIVNPKFIQPSNMKSIALSVATDGLLSIGLTLALILGGIELSVGGVAAMTCVIAGQMALMGVNIWVASWLLWLREPYADCSTALWSARWDCRLSSLPCP